jgi:hypothetical protein
MAGNTQGLHTLIKQSAPEAVWTHCMIHRESLATKELCPELNEVLNVVIKSVNYIKTRPLKSRLFAQICEEMEHNSSHFYEGESNENRKIFFKFNLLNESGTQLYHFST